MNKKKLTIFIVIAVLVVAGLAGVIIKTSIDAKTEKEKKLVKDQRQLYSYAKSLHLVADFPDYDSVAIVDGKGVIVEPRNDEWGLISDLSLHNTFYPANIVTEDELLSEFDSYCDTLEKSEVLDRYQSELSSLFKELSDREMRGAYNDLYVLQYWKLEHEHEIKADSATREQLIMAADEVAADIHNELQVSVDSEFDRFIAGEAYIHEDGKTFKITDFNMDGEEWDSYSVGERIDLDNDGITELILNGPYGGIYIDDYAGRSFVFARGEGTADQLSYVFYDGAYWIVKSDTTHSGRSMYSFVQYCNTTKEVDSFTLNAEYDGQSSYDENSTFTYRGEKISMEEYERIYKEIFG